MPLTAIRVVQIASGKSPAEAYGLDEVRFSLFEETLFDVVATEFKTERRVSTLVMAVLRVFIVEVGGDDECFLAQASDTVPLAGPFK